MALYVGNTRYTPMLGNSRASFMVEDALPYDAEIEYLQSSGTQRIDTGIMYDSSVVVDTKVYVLTSATGSSVFGIYWDGGGGAQRWNFQATTSSPYGNAQMGTKQKTFALPKNTWVTLRADYRYITSNGTSYDSGASAFNPTDDVEIPIFARHLVYTQNTHDSYINMRLESFKITKGGVLVRDFIPVRVGQVGYMYDRVSGTLFGNSGSGNFVLGNDIIEVEYLQSTGTQYIDTTIGVTSMLITEIEVSLESGFSYGNTSFIFGGYKTGGYCSYSIAAASSSAIRVPNGNGFSNLSVSWGSNGTKHNLSYKFGSIKFDDVQKGTYSGSSNTSVNVRLFGRNSPDSGDAYAIGNIRLYKCKMTDGDGSIVRDFIPVRVGTTGYMLDKVEHKLYGNAGTGSFILGNDKN